MKKKNLTAVAVVAGALILGACGNKAETETTAAQAETAAEAETETEAAEEAETEAQEEAEAEAEGEADLSGEAAGDTEIFEDDGYFDGTVTGMAGTQIMVLSDDGETYTFDIAAAETDPDYDILPGAYVEVSYDGVKAEGGVTDATMVSVLMSLEEQAADKGEDPALQGTVKSHEGTNLVVTDPNGEDHSFDASIAQIVTEGGLAAGTPVMVTYVGSIDEEIQEDSEDGTGSGIPVAIKVVTPDSAGAETASEITGTVTYVEGGQLSLETPAMVFEFTGDPALFATVAVGDQVKVSYTGSVGNKTIQATSLEKVQ